MRILLYAAAVCASLVQSGGDALAKDRSTSAAQVAGWEAVGRLTMANRAMCTGALIAPDMVLTAAHCLYDPVNGRPVKPERIQFEAGLTGGTAKASRMVVSATVHPGYRHDRRSANVAGTDLAVLRLGTPIDETQIRPFVTDARPDRGDALGVISYTHVQADSPIWQHPCNVLARKGDIVVMNCEVDFGASGAPVFAVQQNGAHPRLVSVISSKAAMGNRPVSVGTVLEDALKVLLNRAG